MILGKTSTDIVRPPIEQPGSFKSQTADATASTIDPDWWKLYRDADLEQLLATATASNQTIQQAVAAVDQARALARVAASFLAPTISTNPTFTRQRTPATRASNFTGQVVGTGVTFMTGWLR